MPWYYVGPEAKPVGPLSLEELHARRLSGAITPDTYIIEHVAGGEAPRDWKRYREIFPAAAAPLPPVPLPGTPYVPAAPVVPPPAPNPLFPSAASVTGTPAPVVSSGTSYSPPSHLDPYYHQGPKTNIWCLWGCWLGIASPFLLLICGLGFFMAIASIICCMVGMVDLSKHRDQKGRGMALAGLVGAVLALILSLAIIAAVVIPKLKLHSLTVTEQTSNDSE